MENSFGKSLIINNNETVFNIENTATFLGISAATVRNWVKCGHLRTTGESTKYFFHKNEIEGVKAKILNGDLKKLNRRANKVKADRTFIPDEYVQNNVGFIELNYIVDFIINNNVDLSTAILLVCLNLLKKENILREVNIKDIIKNRDLFFANKQIGEEIKSWLPEIKIGGIKENFAFLLDCDIPQHKDILGLLYQSLLSEGQKSESGSYYTPENIVNDVIIDYVKKDSKVLDPCCGTGQFLLAFSNIVEDPLNIYGIDSDETAVKIARINILIKFKDKNFIPNIFCKNTLFDVGNYDLFSVKNKETKDFDIIATNPPWGVHFSNEDIEKLAKLYPEIESFESFSYFLKKSLDLLRKDGIISFILPESILSVKTHKDIREIILKNYQIKKIMYLDRVFKNVFTPVIRLDVKKIKNLEDDIQICKKDEKYYANQMKWLDNQDFVFNIHTNEADAEIIDKIYQTNHTTLINKADWALGIVTGDNKNFIAEEGKEGFEPIYRGKDVERFLLNEPISYIKFLPDKFQQCAPSEKYRSKEKLIYRFISKYLIFAYDDEQKLTLNSANIVIPQIPGYPMKVIAAVFNSSLYQFIFQKKFSTIKVLRNHIEQLPLPLWDQETFSKIIELVNGIIQGEDNFEKLDNYINDKFKLSNKEKKYILKFNK